MTDRMPNLFLVGAMRSGTTALHEVLGTHPDIFMSPVKEPAFFADPDELATDSRVASAAGYAGNLIAYRTLFQDAGSARYAGESSTHYTKQPRINGVAERIGDLVAAPRILYLIRDPIRRTLSHYRYHVRAKYERKACLDALRTEPIYCAASDYAMQIRPFLDHFGDSHVRIMVLEEVVAAPEAELGAMFTWLDLDPSLATARLPQRNEVTGSIERARGPEALHRLGRTSSYQRLARAVLPQGLRSKVRGALNRPVAADETDRPEVLDYLRRVHAPHVDAVEELLGRRIDAWTAPRAAGGTE